MTKAKLSVQDYNETIEEIWNDLAKTQDVLTLIQAAAHATQYMADKVRYMSSIETVALLVNCRIGDSLGKLETLKR